MKLTQIAGGTDGGGGFLLANNPSVSLMCRGDERTMRLSPKQTSNKVRKLQVQES